MNNQKTISQFKTFFFQTYEEPSKELLIELGVKEYAYIKHDLDTWTEEDEKESPEHVTGTLKKAHYHVYVTLYKKKTLNGFRNIVKKFHNIQDFLINQCTSPAGAIRYLVHKDNPEKFQYSGNQIETNMDLRSYFDLELSDSAFIGIMLELAECGEFKHFRDMVRVANEYGKMDLLVSKAYFFKSLL